MNPMTCMARSRLSTHTGDFSDPSVSPFVQTRIASPLLRPWSAHPLRVLQSLTPRARPHPASSLNDRARALPLGRIQPRQHAYPLQLPILRPQFPHASLRTLTIQLLGRGRHEPHLRRSRRANLLCGLPSNQCPKRQLCVHGVYQRVL